MANVDRKIQAVVTRLYRLGFDFEELRQFVVRDGQADWHFPKVELLYKQIETLEAIGQQLDVFDAQTQSLEILERYQRQQNRFVDLYKIVNPVKRASLTASEVTLQ